jgi:mRNA interferase MazF
VSDRGDLVWLEFTPQAGSEQRGRRPALIPSPKTYNGKVDLTLFCLVTSKINGYPFEVELPDGYDVSGVVLSDQLKSLDWRSRKVNFIERASSDVRALRLINSFEEGYAYVGNLSTAAIAPWRSRARRRARPFVTSLTCSTGSPGVGLSPSRS